MTSWKGQTRGGVLGYRIFVWTLKYLGLTFAYVLLAFVALYFVFTSGAATRAIFRFYRQAMHYHRFRALLSIYANYYMFGQILLDKVAMLAGFRHRFTFDFEGEAHLRSMKNGGLLVSGHVGNWEIAGQLLNRLEKRIHIILFDAEHERIKGYLSEVMANRDIHFIVIRGDFSHLAEIRNAFAAGDIVAMHGDRFIEGNKTLVFEFLGRPAKFPAGPVNIAARFGVPVSYVFAVKERISHYHFYATPPVMVEHSLNLKQRDAVYSAAIRPYIQKFEEIVRKYPLQWFNYYDFWNMTAAPAPVIKTGG